VFVQVSDPVQAGFVSSLARPGGNITGFTTYEYSMAGKWLEILKETVPRVTRVLLLLNPENTAQWAGYSEALAAFASRAGVQFVPGAVRDRGEIEHTIASFAREPDGGLIVPPDAILDGVVVADDFDPIDDGRILLVDFPAEVDHRLRVRTDGALDNRSDARVEVSAVVVRDVHLVLRFFPLGLVEYAFRRILLAQLPISAINTTLTALYLVVVLPAFDVHLPFAKTLIAVTFIAGLLPVVGNLISNTAIFLVSLSLSFNVAMAALGYLVVIHKLEYFLNARIIGVRIDAHAWELLLAMLVLESAYGFAGLIAAPVFYAYLKSELAAQGLLGKPAPPAKHP
jgi:hypothetical protein